MKKFTDIFIIRPVLAIVVSLLILILGVRSFSDLPIREYPKMENTLITVQTVYPGASPDLIQGFITSRLEKSIATADGIDYMTSASLDGVSIIQVYVKLNFDPNVAFTEVMSKVSEVSNELPIESDKPVITKTTGSSIALVYIAFSSKNLTPEQTTDYLSRVVQPRLEAVSGVAKAEILGGKTFAMRIWLDNKKMASLGVSSSDVAQALRANNFQSAAGSVKGDYIQVGINPQTSAQTTNDFNQLVIKRTHGALIRVRDIGHAELGSDNYDSSVYFNGKKAIFIGITAMPTANPLTVINQVRQVLPALEDIYPPGLSSKVVYDATKYIKAAMHEVVRTILEATLIVIVVIFCFLGSLRTVLIPVVTIPLSLVGALFCMSLLGYSINLLTLLALVLAIGMVVDDAIVVAENIHRHIEEGLTPFQSAIKGAREIATAIISMTLTQTI